MGGFAEDFQKGSWTNGLFAFDKPMLCLQMYCCTPCAIAQIHNKRGNPKFSKTIACLAAFCGFGGLQIFFMGAKLDVLGSGGKDEVIMAILKTWCCGLCYLTQQYREVGASEDWGEIM